MVLSVYKFLCQHSPKVTSPMRLNLWLIVLMFISPLMATDVPTDGIPSGCPLVRIEVECLPDLNIPRAGHQLFCTSGEYVVAGGHTNGFVPTPTAEYFHDGQWHLMQMVYNHDAGFSVMLNGGRCVLLAGGCSEAAGIGQTYMAEMYDPATHTFDGFTILDRKRTLASGMELDSGRVVVAGNWYHDDAIEMFDGRKNFTQIKEVSEHRSTPYIFRIAADDALIFGCLGNRVDTYSSSIADRLKGDPVNIPLFDIWKPMMVGQQRSADSFIGDASKAFYAYLFAVQDSTGQVAIAQIVNGEVSLLPTNRPVPMTCSWGAILYYSGVIADSQRGLAYLMGINSNFRQHPEKGCRHYVLAIDYSQAKPGTPAQLTLYHTDPLKDSPDFTPVLTDDGNLLMAGGLTTAQSNFYPSGHAYLLHVAVQQASLQEPLSSKSAHWLWLVAAVSMITGIAVILLMHKRRRPQLQDVPVETPPCDVSTAEPSETAVKELMDRINELMEHQKPYLNSELKISDLADIFRVHRNDISACINSQAGCSFTQYVNRYRISYAKELMRRQPDKKVSSVGMESGFGSEQTFFKTFRAVTGMSPKEWISQAIDSRFAKR